MTADGLSFYPGAEAIVVCGHSTRVPMAEFRREEAQILLDYVCPAKGQERTVLYNVLPELEIVEIFGIGTDRLADLRRDYPTHRILGVNTMVLETMWRHDCAMGSAGRRLYAYCHDGEMLLFCYDAQGLRWANTFPVPTPQERLFLFLSAWRQLGFDAEKDECLLLCCDNMAEPLKPYIRHIATLSPADVLGQKAAHRDAPFDILVI